MPHHSALDHAIVHHQQHGSSVRIVANADVSEAAAELKLLFPHESVLSTAIGCCHACLYTVDTPASLVAQRIADHLRDVADHGDAEPAPSRKPGMRSAPDEPLPDFFGPERHGR